MAASENTTSDPWRLIVVGGHTRSIGKTQLVCDILSAFPRQTWIAGKITQYGHGVCAQNGENCDCAPREHVCALDWETHRDSGTDSARFLAAGAGRSFWLRTKQGFLAEGLPLLRDALAGVRGEAQEGFSALIVESNSLLQFLKPSLYFAIVDPAKEDFKASARAVLDRADAIILRASRDQAPLTSLASAALPARLLREKPSLTQREGEPLPKPLEVLVARVLQRPGTVSL